VNDLGGFAATLMACFGDRLGLFKDMANCPPQTVEELAACTHLNPRYVREWLAAMVAAGYVHYEPSTEKYDLPAERRPVLAQETGPFFLGGIWGELPELMRPLPAVEQAFRDGGGAPQTAYPDAFYHHMDRFTAGWHANHLLQEWVPAAGLDKTLAAGVSVADVGCGAGRAIIQLAKAYPQSQYVGYDVHPPTIARARELAREAGVEDRVRFEVKDVSRGLPEKFDVITTFDVVHDAVDPEGLLRTIRKALKPGGLYLNLEVNCSDKLEENQGPVATLFLMFSVTYCMTTSLAHGGAGLGTHGLPESKVRELADAAGFGSVQRLAVENPFNILYALR
jgi:2-polyprenyl-3-methyl-5-hydroxy-6-metoxy-1,4-benzoquinol methylase